MRFGLAFALIAAILAGCSTTNEDDLLEFRGKSAQKIYLKAEADLAKKDYNDAIKGFEALRAMYPNGPQRQQALIDLIYAYYENGDYPSAIASADHFIRLYPGSPRIAYAYFLRGKANLKSDRGPIQNLVGIDESKRDPEQFLEAFKDFRTVVVRFPDSKYAAESRKNMFKLRDLFAKHHLDIARFYYKRGAYIAAVNRASEVVGHFPKAPQTRAALELMVKSYRHLGLNERAKRAAEQLHRV